VISDLVSEIAEQLLIRKETIATAESCTGGLIGASFTELAGSSQWYLGGFVTYTNEMKHTFLGVPSEVFETVGAVSEECAREMSTGTRNVTGSDWSISVTGIAGPGGGSDDKPVGLVYISVASAVSVVVTRNLFDGDRESVRFQAREKALSMVIEALRNL